MSERATAGRVHCDRCGGIVERDALRGPAGDAHLDDAATQRLESQLDALALPMEHPDDPAHRSRSRVGSRRHEVGHRYWGRLVGMTDDVDRFRHLFGDERAEHTSAVDGSDQNGLGSWDPTRFVSAWASSHPLEDWAETVASYLLIIDAIQIAATDDPTPPPRGSRLAADRIGELDLPDILAAWQSVNAATEALGGPVRHPLPPIGAVVDKLDFVHRQIAAHTQRDRFYADRRPAPGGTRRPRSPRRADPAPRNHDRTHHDGRHAEHLPLRGGGDYHSAVWPLPTSRPDRPERRPAGAGRLVALPTLQ